MTDVFTKEKRSEVMSKIKGRDTKFEVNVRKELFRQGFRFRKNDKRYPGKPDIILPKYKTAIQINGCFWHWHKGCKLFVMPKTRTDFWKNKLETNKTNDKKNNRQLRYLGFAVLIIWECELKKNFECEINRIVEYLNGQI
jgi:DNA mismatch endonuclease, patch repair protein